MKQIPTIEDYLKTPVHPLRQKGGYCLAIRRERDPGKPLVTVFTIVKNRKETLSRTIMSVLNQSYSNIEYIVIDGASTDGTLEVIKQFDDKIDLWISEPDSGTSDAGNKAISIAKGEFIFWLSSDDWIDRNFIEEAVCAFLRSGADFVFGNMMMYKNKISVAEYKGDQEYVKSLMSGYPYFMFPAMIIKKEYFNKIGLINMTYKYFSDYEWVLRLHLSGAKGFYLRSLAIHREVGGVGEELSVQSILEHFRLLKQYNLPKSKTLITYTYYLIRRIIGKFVRILLPRLFVE